MMLSPEVAREYERLWQTCVVLPETLDPDIAHAVRNDMSIGVAHAKMDGYRNRYDAIEKEIGVPWYFTLAVHSLEASGRMNCHLHNGDPLSARTVQVPAGRPKNGNPPFTWEESAADALRLKMLDQWDDWSIAGLLFQLERYNGFGYRTHGINTPYLWSGTNHYTAGKYVADGKFDAHAVSKQCGGAALIKWLSENGMVKL